MTGRLLRMRKLHVLILLLALLGVGAACGSDEAGEVPDNAVAVVGDSEITKAEFDALLERAEGAYAQQGRPFPKPGTAEY